MSKSNRRSSRQSTRRSSSSESRGRSSRSGGSSFRGSAGREQAELERQAIKRRQKERQEAGNEPFRYWMEPDSERQIVVLDDQIQFFRYEHALPNPQRNNIPDRFFPCLNHETGCQICKEFGDTPYYGMYMSVIDLEPYIIKSGPREGDEIPWSRKLFMVKSGMQRDWFRAEDSLKREDEHRPMRGAIFRIFRDDEKKPRTGNSIEFIEYMDEEELSEYVREWEDRDRKLNTEDCSVPFDYDEIMPDWDEKEIAERLNLEHKPRPGSREEAEQEMDDGDDPYGEDDLDGYEDDVPFDPDEPEDFEEEPDEPEEPRGRGRRKTEGKPSGRRGATRAQREKRGESGKTSSPRSRRRSR